MSIRMSWAGISTSTSSASGSTATVAAEVWIRPLLSVAGTRCTRCTPDSNFSAAKTPLPGNLRHQLAIPAELGRRRLDHLEPPAPRLRQPLVHPRQVGGEERRLLAARARPGSPGSPTARPPRPAAAAPAAPPAPPPAAPRAAARAPPAPAPASRGRRSSRSASAASRAQRPPAVDRLDHRLQLGILARQRRQVRHRRARVQPRLEELEAAADLVELLLRDHAPDLRENHRRRKGGSSAAAPTPPAPSPPPPEGQERRRRRPRAPPARSPRASASPSRRRTAPPAAIIAPPVTICSVPPSEEAIPAMSGCGSSAITIVVGITTPRKALPDEQHGDDDRQRR